MASGADFYGSTPCGFCFQSSTFNIIMTVLPFFGGRKKRQQMMQEVKEFSELVKEQYNFLMQQLEKVLKDYFNLSDRVKEMHSEIFSLKGKLSEAIALQCVNKECIQRNNGNA